MIFSFQVFDVFLAKINRLQAVKIDELGVLCPVLKDPSVPVHCKLFYLEQLERPILLFPIINIEENSLKSIIGITILQLVNHYSKVERFVDPGHLGVLETQVHVVDAQAEICHDHAFKPTIIGESAVHLLFLCALAFADGRWWCARL